MGIDQCNVILMSWKGRGGFEGVFGLSVLQLSLTITWLAKARVVHFNCRVALTGVSYYFVL